MLFSPAFRVMNRGCLHNIAEREVIRTLVKAGHCEVVPTDVDLTRCGRDLTGTFV